MKKLPTEDEPTLAELIARKRAAGPDREFEELLARVWRCPHCQHETTIEFVIIDVGQTKDFLCPKCEHDGIGPVDGRAQ